MTDTSMPLFAKDLGIEKLYHYDKFRDNWLTSMLAEKHLCCSELANLNDPWDCCPTLDPAPMKDPAIFRKNMDWFHSQARVPLTGELKEELENRLRTDPAYLDWFLKGFRESVQKMIFSRRMYCLTKHPDNILMWSYYAENHCGICLEFSTGVPMFGHAMQVTYSGTYPLWLEDISERQSIRMVTTKSKEWAHEDEFRVLSAAEGTPSPYLSPIGRFLPLPDGALTAIIAGCKADYKTIKGIVEAHAPRLPVKRAVKVDHRFQLQIVD